MQAFEDTLKLSPNYFEAYIGIGRAYINSNRNEEAIGPLKNAITINPGHADSYERLGAAYRNLGEHEKALSPYLEFARIDFRSPVAHF